VWIRSEDMGKFWNQEVKKLAVTFLTFFFFYSFICNLYMGFCAKQMRREYNDLLAVFFGNVTEMYPELPEEELIRVLTEEEHMEQGAAILAGYGAFGEQGGRTFASFEKWNSLLQAGINGMLILLCAGCVKIFGGYLKKRQNKLRKLGSYMREIERGNYRLEIDDNGDDELSGFRNELYKLTVFLKEQADIASGQRKALADSTADISHQLKTPLTSITILVDNLAENEDMDPVTRRRFLGEVSAQLSGMSWLVTAMLKLSRLDAGVVVLEKKEVHIRLLAAQVIQKLEMIAEWRQIEVVSLIEKDFVIMGDFKWLTESLMNLVKNAVEHSSPGGRVEIRAEENEVYTLLSVKDYGEGISEEEQQKLFRRFYRGRDAAADSAGIGLALAKEIIEKQDGYITVESVQGEGTSFLVKFLKCH